MSNKAFEDHLFEEIRTNAVNQVAAEYARLYRESRESLVGMVHGSPEHLKAVEDATFYADCYSEHVKACGKIGIKCTVKLEY